MKLDHVELRRIAMPLVSPFRTSFGTQTTRDILLVRAVAPDAEGWGECVATAAPLVCRARLTVTELQDIVRDAAWRATWTAPIAFRSAMTPWPSARTIPAG
jgi:L-alanine-DL-glutamate epimerase-like enolase superfamily enzyme